MKLASIFLCSIFLFLLQGCIFSDNTSTEEIEQVSENFEQNGNFCENLQKIIQSNSEGYEFELIENSDDSYVLDSWEEGKKESYYKIAGKLTLLEQKRYNVPLSQSFTADVENKIGVKLNSNKIIEYIPFHIFEVDSLSGYRRRLVFFPQEKVATFETELPIISRNRIKYLCSSDYQGLDYSQNEDKVLNRILVSTEGIDNYSSHAVMYYLIQNFHIKSDESSLINSLDFLVKRTFEGEDFYSDFLQYLSFRDQVRFDQDFVKAIRKLDAENRFYLFFKKAILQSSILLKSGKVEQFISSLDEIYDLQSDSLEIDRQSAQGEKFIKIPSKDWNKDELVEFIQNNQSLGSENNLFAQYLVNSNSQETVDNFISNYVKIEDELSISEQTRDDFLIGILNQIYHSTKDTEYGVRDMDPVYYNFANNCVNSNIGKRLKNKNYYENGILQRLNHLYQVNTDSEYYGDLFGNKFALINEDAKSVNILSKPEIGSSVLMTLKSHESVEVIEKSGTLWKVKKSDQIGYIDSKYLDLIYPL